MPMSFSNSKFFLAAFLLFYLTGCARYQEQMRRDLNLTLNEGLLYIPDKYIKGANRDHEMFTSGPLKYVVKIIDNTGVIGKVPTVIYLHGCSGIKTKEIMDIALLARSGYAVIAPDSFARSRAKSCDPSTHHYYGRDAFWLRMSEAKHAVDFARKLDWVDQDLVFMMGYSEGGIVTARYSRGDLAGKVILAWTCTTTNWLERRGVAGPKDEPVLSVVASRDPWFTLRETQGHCGLYMRSKDNATSIVVPVKSPLHSVQRIPKIQKRIIRFLNSIRFKIKKESRLK